mmetsp:Transcript_36808/g.90879  ORF Transcript_36808/g.90879 Transcript_36808/m.90879 type:complete len:213 (+) Transcript_36808:5000-5638(+)
MPRRHRHRHESVQALDCDHCVVDAKFVHVAHEKSAVGARGPRSDPHRLGVPVEEPDVGVDGIAGVNPVDVEADVLEHVIDSHGDVVPLPARHGGGGTGRVLARRGGGGGLRQETNRGVRVVPAAHITSSSTHQKHGPAEVAQHRDRLRLLDLSRGLNPNLRRQVVGWCKRSAVRNSHGGVDTVEENGAGSDRRSSRRRRRESIHPVVGTGER